jgi:hypothetical protein
MVRKRVRLVGERGWVEVEALIDTGASRLDNP